MRHARFGKMSQQTAVIAGDFDDVLGREFAQVTIGTGGGVRDPCFGIRRKINVVAEQLNGRHEVGDLKEPTVRAHGEAQGEARLGLGQILGCQNVVGQGLLAEIEN